MKKIRLRQVENGFILILNKKEYFCPDQASARAKAEELFMAEIMKELRELENKLEEMTTFNR